MYGFINYNGDTYYTDPETGELATGITIINEKPYFFGISKFKLQKGLIGYNGDYYYSNSECILQTGMLEVNGNYYYFDKDNDYKALSGWQTIDGLRYYFDPVTKIRYQGIHQVEGKNYFFGVTKGKVMYGFIGYEGDTYYTDPETGELASGVTVIDNIPYFFGISKFKLQKGFIGYNGDYYYSNSEGILQTGMLEVNGNYYYFDKDNDYKALSGWQTIDELKYYFDPVTKIRYQGIHNVEGKNYFFGVTKGKVMYGFIGYEGDTYYTDPSTGELASGVTIIDGVPYFFGISKFKLQKGFIGYNGDYYYSNSEGILQTGMIEVNGNYYYFDKNSNYKALSGLQEIDDATYYFDPITKIRAKGVTLIDDKYYFFGIKYGKKMYGWINDDGVYYYADPTTGELFSGLVDIDNATYYFSETTKKMKTGKVTLEEDGKTYYFNPNNGILVKGHQIINGNEYFCDVNGVLEKVQYNPVYYSQKDDRWGFILYGLGLFRATGCAPTSMAMAFSSILNRQILPTEVANYLYYNTNEFNKKVKGSSGMAIIYASKHFNIKTTALKSKLELINALKDGKLVFAAMGNGKFATPFYNHAIILTKYNAGLTYAFDPLKSENNGWVSVDQVFNEQSKDPDDSTGGSNFYSLEEF